MELLLNVKEKGILPVICFFIFICVLVLSGCGRQEEENLQTEDSLQEAEETILWRQK